MPPSPTRTLHPLPFQDLEPHRFEDLVRQLAYEFRDWASLEAVGRSGADEGIDIRGIESIRSNDVPYDEGVSTIAEKTHRVWIFQCKREKAMPASRVRAAIAESISADALAPYGFVLAAGCDLSKKARDAFREEMVARGVEEFAIWARGELEDQLFQPKNGTPCMNRLMARAESVTQTRGCGGELSASAAVVPRKAAARSRVRQPASSRFRRGGRGSEASTWE